MTDPDPVVPIAPRAEPAVLDELQRRLLATDWPDAPSGIGWSAGVTRTCCADLMLVHGLADDNVAVANTLRLSTALLAAARPHTVLPLSGVTHMANSENLVLLELDFLQRSLRT